mgnify:FL=1
MPILDVFSTDAFSTLRLTDAVNKMPFVPGRARRLGIFVESGITTTTIAVEERDGFLKLLPDRARGAPADQFEVKKRNLRDLRVPHFVLDDTVTADELQDVRAFGSEMALEGVQQVVNQRLGEMMSSHDATVEFGSIGAIKGIILDADGTTVIHDLFTIFGITQTSVDFVLGTAATKIRKKLFEVKRAIETALGAATFERIHGFAGKTWFERYISHADVEKAFDRFQDGARLRDDPRFQGFEFADVTIEEYRGKVSGVDFVADSEVHFFPIGVPNLFKSYFAPADFMEAVNTVGLPRYAKQAPDTEFNRFVKLHTQSNPLSICVRPGVLVKGTTSN